MTRAAIDTHALIWYANDDPRLSKLAVDTIDDATLSGQRIAVSSMCLVEIVYLVEKLKVGPLTFATIISLLDRDELLTEVAVDRDIARAMRSIARALIPELPDRVIAATDVHLGVPLITADGKIRASGVATIW